METIYLPYLSGNDTIQFALERMRQMDKRAAVVWDVETDERHLFMNEHLVEALMKGAVCCSELNKKDGQLVAPISESLQASGEIYLWDFLEQKLDHKDAQYGYLFSPRPERVAVILVISRHEGGTYSIVNARKVCKCTNPQTPHRADSPPAYDGEVCTVCGYAYECY